MKLFNRFLTFPKIRDFFKKKCIRFFLWACAAGAALIVAINVYIVLYSRHYIYTEQKSVPKRYTAIVPGARAYPNNVISFVFRDRIAGGMELLTAGTVQKVLVSGDHGRKNYDEVNSALSYIRQMYATDDSLVFLDHAGFSTYETMYRARDVFCVKEAVIVTQPFHMARSVFIARKLGLDAVGYIPEEKNPFSRRTKQYWQLRESLARVKAFFSVTFHKKPTYLGSEIPISGDGRATRD
ncbi:MAG: YdcF family protein [Treponema sp.]|nr:YdcF family protein [Treponema sp.]